MRTEGRSLRAIALVVASIGCLAGFACAAAVDGDGPATPAGALAFVGSNPEDNARDSSGWWLDNYGAVDPAKDPRAARAQALFDRVSAAADKRDNRLPRLALIGAAGDPYAVALPDGTILLTRGALDFCYGPLRGPKLPQRQGDLRLAFVLGHELAHLAADDFWHRSAFAAAQRFPAASGTRWREVRSLLNPDSRDLQRSELEADSVGALTMAMADLSPGELLHGDPDFFTKWVSQVAVEAAYEDPSHPPPEDRAATLKALLTGLGDEIDVFHFGVRLAQLGRYPDAIALLAHFNERFASREVLSDLGYASYQQAVKVLAACDGSPAIRFRLPVAIDDETLASRARLRGGSSLCLESERVRKGLADAEHYLELATEKDSAYLAARHNLLAVYLVAGKAASALALAEETLQVAPGDAATLVAKGIALYLFGIDNRMDTFEGALHVLEKAETDPRWGTDAVFARAVMLTEHGRIAGARAAWERFLALEPHGSHADLARERLGLADEPQTAAALAPSPPIPLGVVAPETRARLAKLERRDVAIGGMSVTIYRGQGLQALQLGEAVEVVEQAASAPVAHPGSAPVRVETPRGVFLRYPGVGFDMDGDRTRAVVYFAPAR